MRHELSIALVLVLAGMALPASADVGTYDCSILLGTEVSGPGGDTRVTSTTPWGGVGECWLHETEETSKVGDLEVSEGCQIHADTDDDAFVETIVQEGQVYAGETGFVAFCDAGVTMAEPRVTFVEEDENRTTARQ